MGIIFNGPDQRNNTADPHNNYSGKIGIEIRGASSAGWAKKSYRFETQQEDGSNRNVSLLGLPVENDWILYASYYDRSLMRNVLTFKLARQLGWYASRYRYCELILNGEYQGIYILLEKIKRDKNRVDIAKLDSTDISGDALTGGYIIKIDKEPWNPGFDSPYAPFPEAGQPIRYQYHYPKGDEILVEQINYISGYMTEYESVMAGNNYTDPLEGYNKYINVQSFVDYLILNELSRNVDGYRLSAFFYKDSDNNGGKLSAGPVWDYNFSFGNVGYYNSWLIEGWQLIYFADDEDFHTYDNFFIPFWWKILFEDENFNNEISKRWWELRVTIFSKENIFSFIDSTKDTLDEAKDRNFEFWGGPGDPYEGGGWFPPIPEGMQVNNYSEEINYLKNWISDRIDWMDTNIENFTNIADGLTLLQPGGFELEKNYPNPFNPRTIINYELQITNDVDLSIYNALGQKVATLVSEKQLAGSHQVEWDATGFSSGVYYYRLTTGVGFSQTRKLTLLK
jgi:hypothetical protein